ncbi:MAG: hypothetical protein INF43_00755 [Alphaproteobacteria bacterium]|jgi:hypothetical protein|nr:hypothetical protein [Alphaproteobacteria bacterium]
MMLFLNILIIALLAMVAGLLLAVGQQVKVWRRAVADSPLLAEQLATQLLAARQGLESLRKGVVEQGPELSRLLSEGGKLRTELQFLLEKAEQRAARLDLQLDKSAPAATGAKVLPTKAAAKNALIEQVAGANGHAIQPSQPSQDPLEELLAGLQGTPGGQSTSGVRRGPVTQAELALQQRVKGSA